MNFHILTLFPEMVMQGLNTSIIGRACEKGLLSINAVNIRDFTTDKHKKVDDYPYGGGAGMLMQAQPVYDAYLHVVNHMKTRQRPRVVYVTPQGKVFNQAMAKEMAMEHDLILLCGHYEGIDERVLEEINQLEKTDFINPAYIKYNEYSPVIAAAALLLLFIGILLKNTILLRLP